MSQSVDSGSAHQPEPGHQQKVIVVGVDDSAESKAAMRWAIDVAHHIHARIQAVAVWHLPQDYGAMPPIPTDVLAEEAKSWLERAVPPDIDVPVDAVVVQGDPTNVLLQHAQRAALVVLGNHGHGPIHNAIFGSVAHRCAHQAPCPVVLVPLHPS